MAADLVYQTSAELKVIEQELLPRLQADRLCFKILPMRDVKRSRLVWDQLDNYTGLQNVRGLDGEPTRVLRTGAKRYEMIPGVYGEFMTLDEEEITTRAAMGTPGTPVDVTDLVSMAQTKLLKRRLDRVELIIWTLLATGTFAVPSLVTGSILHTDTFPIQVYTATVPWATSGTATPLANFRSVQLLSRGQSVSFGAGAIAVMNRTTANALLSNTNQLDLAGRRFNPLNSVLNLPTINEILTGEDLPTIVIYDEGYIDDNKTFQLYIPNGKVIVVGRRASGEEVGEYDMTINANNPNYEAGAYTKVIDRGVNTVPRTLEVHDGHNGGPVLFHPGAIVVMNV